MKYLVLLFIMIFSVVWFFTGFSIAFNYKNKGRKVGPIDRFTMRHGNKGWYVAEVIFYWFVIESILYIVTTLIYLGGKL